MIDTALGGYRTRLTGLLFFYFSKLMNYRVFGILFVIKNMIIIFGIKPVYIKNLLDTYGKNINH